MPISKMVHECNSAVADALPQEAKDAVCAGRDDSSSSSNDERTDEVATEAAAAAAAAVGVTTDAEVAQFVAEISMDDCAARGWTLAARRAQCDVWTMRSAAASTVKVKIDGTAAFADVPVAVLLEVVTAPAHMDKWDKSMLEFRTVARLDAHTRVNYYSVAMPLPLKNRDWVLRQSTVAPPRATPPAARAWAIFNRSCAWPTLPARADYVRANCILNGWYIAPTADGRGSRVYYYAHNEFLGAVPPALVNWALRVFSASVITKLRQACDAVLREKQQQGRAVPEPWCNDDPAASPAV